MEMMTKLEARALEILRGYGDPAGHEEMTSTITRGHAEVLEAKEMGVLVRHTRAGQYMLAGNPYRMLTMAMQLPHDARDILLHGAMPVENLMGIKRIFDRSNLQPFINFAYYGELPPEDEDVDIRPLGMDSLDFLYANYGHASREYLEERIRDGVMIGAYVDGQLAGFIGEHIEGAMGLLHIMPEFRRHRLGFKLERAGIRHAMLAGHTPFCQVAAHNTASRSLQRRIGMTEAEGILYWITNDPL